MREVLGPDLSVTDKEIEDSLWHYYYDIEKTINYLISKELYEATPMDYILIDSSSEDEFASQEGEEEESKS